MHKAFIKRVINMLLFLLSVISFSKVSSGGGVVLLILLSCYFALSKKIGMFLVLFFMLPFLTEMNGELVGNGAVFRYGARVATFASTGLLLLQLARDKGRRGVPIGGIFIYLVCATISSMQGYCPPVSYLKLVNFAVFILGLYFAGRVVTDNANDILQVRAALMACSIFVVFGSYVLFTTPSIAYMSSASLAAQGYTEKQIAAQLAEGGLNLFKGVANHSQTLASMLVSFIGWTVCDLLFIEGGSAKLHKITIIGSLPLLYLTRSRTALLGFAVLISLLLFYGVPRAQIPNNVKHRTIRVLWGLIFISLMGIVFLQIRGAGFTKWVRKTESSNDDRGLVEAVTESRMSLIEQNMYDFNRNRLLGSGFQVSEAVADMYQHSEGLVITAPIEKGVLPLMVLGEGGIVGAIAFAIFLIMFYSTCSRNRYTATATLFTVYVMLNMSEATFFSPNGGGAHWVVLLIGGFVVDIAARTRGQLYLGRVTR